MLRSLFVLTFVTSAEASRVQTHSDLEAKWGASCESLQNRFHTQVQTCQTALDAANSAESTGVVSQGRFMMRMYGISRTLRRARACAWVIDNNSEDIENMRGMTQQLLDDNPCGEAASAEMEAAAANDSPQGIMRAISILASNDCEVSEIQEPPGDVSPEQQLQEADEQAQDEIDELMDAEEAAAALIQTSQSTTSRRRRQRRGPTLSISLDINQLAAYDWRNFMRRLGVFFLLLFLVLACAGSAFIITFVIAALVLSLTSAPAVGIGLGALGIGYVSGFIGFPVCAYQMFSRFPLVTNTSF